MAKWATITMAAPACALTAGLALSLLLAVAGRNPIWPREDLNLSEAASARDEAEAVRLIGRGDDPNRPYEIRAGLLFEHAVRLTPLEAAVAAQRAEMVGRLLAHGASLDATNWNRLRCLSRGDDLRRVLDLHRPAAALMDCEAVSPPW